MVTELIKLNLKEGEILLVKVPEDTSLIEFDNLSKILTKIQGKWKNLFVIVPDTYEFTNTTLDELKAEIDEKNK